MVGELITLPLRVGVRATSLALRGTEEVATRAFAVAMKAAAVVRPAPPEQAPSPEERRPSPSQPTPAFSEKPRPEPRPRKSELRKDSPRAEPPARVDPTPPSVDAPSPDPEPEPVHVSEEPTLVEEFAEPGAEDGAGPEVTIDEPWDGYAHTNAKDVIARLDQATQAELAAIALYESANQRRQSVLSAVERQLELVSRGGSLD
jgi:hypothetical protein